MYVIWCRREFVSAALRTSGMVGSSGILFSILSNFVLNFLTFFFSASILVAFGVTISDLSLIAAGMQLYSCGPLTKKLLSLIVFIRFGALAASVLWVNLGVTFCFVLSLYLNSKPGLTVIPMLIL